MASNDNDLENTVRRWERLTSETQNLLAERDDLLAERSALYGKRATIILELSRLGRRFVDTVHGILGGGALAGCRLRIVRYRAEAASTDSPESIDA